MWALGGTSVLNYEAMLLRLLALCCFTGGFAWGSSVLSHEAVIDLAWDNAIVPILHQRFPGASPEELKQARAYAYGGAIVHDMGYYPLGKHYFSDLTHYLRSGDFIENLVREAKDLNELAFALGSIAHYAGDHTVHTVAVNRSVALLYPKLRRKFGDRVTYEQAPAAHLKVEFGFDVVQVAQGHYAPESYHDFIGFSVAKEVLERAFERTYALKLSDAFPSVDLSLGTFRYSVSTVMPKVTKAAWAAREKQIAAQFPGTTRKQFIYRLTRRNYEKEWGTLYERPGKLARFIAFLFNLMPKVGPLKAFAFELPTPETEKLFTESLRQTLSRYQQVLARVRAGQPTGIPNENFDTGEAMHWGKYQLADRTFEKLVHQLAERKFAGVDAALRGELIEFAAGARALPAEVASELAGLKSEAGAQ